MAYNRLYMTLTDDELVLLDGQCRLELQPSVDAAKGRVNARTQFPDLTPGQAGFIADAVALAQLTGSITFFFLKFGLVYADIG